MGIEKDLKEIFQAYGIDSSAVLHKKDNIFYIRTETEQFIVHKVSMNEAQLTLWESVFHYANEYKIESILPVYPTVQGDLFVMRKNHVFYLTPHIETVKTKNIVTLFQVVANIHTKTKRTFIIHKRTLMDSFKRYNEEMKSNRLYLRQMIDLFEQQQYMSPMELQVCSHFHVVDDAFELSIHHITGLLELCEKDENKHMEWSSSLCHNRLSMNYVLEKHVQYITSWEAASLANATEDLSLFCRNEFLRNEYPLADFIEGLIKYDEVYALNDVEEHILAIHLLQPLTYVENIRKYVNTREEKSVISSVIEVERIFRGIANSYYLLHEFEQQKPNIFSEESD